VSDLNRVIHKREGQFFERKGCFGRSKGKVKLRSIRDVAKDLAETLAAMANADGGTIVIGIEDDGAVSGANYPEERLKVLREAPQTHIRPAILSSIRTAQLEGKTILVFETD
jgi:ATP-dependent DNA helicase RecG